MYVRLAAVCAALVLSACAATAPPAGDRADGRADGRPAARDYATRTTYDFERDVQPLLVARDVLSPTPTTLPGAAADYTLERVLMAGPSGFIVPFDADGSLLLRLPEALPPDVPLPLPNLRRLTPDERAYLRRWIEDGVRDASGRPAFADVRDLLFACVQGENHVALIDAETLRIVRRVYLDDHGLPSRPYGPHHVAFEPDGSAWYVSVVSAGAIVKLSMDLSLDPSSPAFVLGRTPAGAFATPGMLAIDPASRRLYAGRSTLSDPLASGFAVVDRTTMALETVATPFNVPHAFALTPDGRFALTAELTGTQAVSRLAVYDTRTEDLALFPLPARGTPRELIHLSLLGPHHMALMGMAGMDHAAPAPNGHADEHGGEANPHAAPDTTAHGQMDHGQMDHGQMDHGQMDHDAATCTDPSCPMHGRVSVPVRYPYTVTLTSRSTDEVLFLSLSDAGVLTYTGSAAAGDGPYHAHAGHDGRTVLVPDQRGDTVTLLDATTRTVLRTVSRSAPGGPLSQPHSPAPGMAGDRFFVSSSNLDGAWTPPFHFRRADGTPGEARDAGNVAAFSATGDVLGVVQLGAYPSGLEPFRRPAPVPPADSSHRH